MISVMSPLRETSDKIVEALLQGHDWPESRSEGKVGKQSVSCC